MSDLRSLPLRASVQRVLPSVLSLLLLVAATACGPEYPRCRNDGQCHDGEFCVDGQCQDCRTDADCSTGQRCNAGACVDVPIAECTSDFDCGPGRGCEAGTCVTRQSTELPPPPPPTEEPSACLDLSVYFGFDESTLTSDARTALQDEARCFVREHTDSVVVTGMTDPRGTEEYNLTLGERRAHAVRDYMGRLGVARSALRTRSVGEEMSEGTDEASWSRDRRVELDPR